MQLLLMALSRTLCAGLSAAAGELRSAFDVMARRISPAYSSQAVPFEPAWRSNRWSRPGRDGFVGAFEQGKCSRVIDRGDVVAGPLGIDQLSAKGL